MRQFGRQLKLVIGSKNESVEITNLRVQFEVQKTLTPEPNPAIIRIYNLNSSNRNRLTSKEFNCCALSVGYEELRMIYSGDIIEVNTIRKVKILSASWCVVMDLRLTPRGWLSKRYLR